MKVLYRHIIFFCFLVFCGRAYSQQDSLSALTYRAINNYVEYSNEVVHALQIMHDEFEYLNTVFNRFVEQQQDTLAYKAMSVFENYDYFTVLPDTLFQYIYDGNEQIRFNLRGKPLLLAGEIITLTQKIESIRRELEDYIKSGRYKTDKHLAKGYDWLRRIEVAYFDIYALQEKLHWSLSTIMSSYINPPINPRYSRVLSQLNVVITQAKRLLRAVRAKDKSSALTADCEKMRALLTDLKKNRSNYLSGIPAEETAIQNRYDQFVKAGDFLLSNTSDYLGPLDTRYEGRERQPYYYYYNIDQLGYYNRYGNGMATLYNKMIKYSGERILWADEMAPIFEVIYPIHPAFDSLRRDSMPDPDWFITQLENMRQDSIRRADSIKNAVKVDTPKVGQPSMNGFAANNLVILIDISASMNAPEKLPLLKKSLEKFLSLLREEDKITIIGYSEEAKMLVPPTSAKEKSKILEKLNELKIETSSNADKGLKLAYIVAKEGYIKGGNNRIILSTDGNFKLQKETQKLIQTRSKKDIRLSVFYFSEKEYSHVRQSLNQIAAWGKGRYSYIAAENAEESLLIEAQSVRKTASSQ